MFAKLFKYRIEFLLIILIILIALIAILANFKIDRLAAQTNHINNGLISVTSQCKKMVQLLYNIKNF
jgi:hypothetical protein